MRWWSGSENGELLGQGRIRIEGVPRLSFAHHVCGRRQHHHRSEAAERLQYEGYQRRQETNEAILELSKQGIPIKQIVKRTGHSRKLVRSVLRGQRCDVFRVRQSSLEEWLPWLDSRWGQGARNASALWREMREKGFRGQIGVAAPTAGRKGRSKRACPRPSARTIARFMTLARDDLSKSDALLVAAIESNVPDLTIARTLIDDFQTMIRSKAQNRIIG